MSDNTNDPSVRHDPDVLQRMVDSGVISPAAVNIRPLAELPGAHDGDDRVAATMARALETGQLNHGMLDHFMVGDDRSGASPKGE
jgi:hypothetical protein